tara:strand:+ start:19 stop:501 length:483 start_codon:yes stop_codon:yes gene_type:complete
MDEDTVPGFSDLLGALDLNLPGYNFQQNYAETGKLPGFKDLTDDEKAILGPLGVLGVAQSSDPTTTATTGFQDFHKALENTYNWGLVRLAPNQKNFAAQMLGFKDSKQAQQSGVTDTYAAYLESILDEAEELRQNPQRMRTMADQAEMGMLDGTLGEGWE